MSGTVFFHVRAMTCGRRSWSRPVLGDPLVQDNSIPKSPLASGRAVQTHSRSTSHYLMCSSWKGSAAEWPLRASLRPTILLRTRKPRTYECGARLRLTQLWSVYFLPTLHNWFEFFPDSISWLPSINTSITYFMYRVGYYIMLRLWVKSWFFIPLVHMLQYTNVPSYISSLFPVIWILMNYFVFVLFYVREKDLCAYG